MGEPQDWVIDRHDVAGMIDRRADEQLRLQQHRGQQTIGITDGIQGADSTGPDIEAINRAAEQAEGDLDWARHGDELDSNRSAPEIADEQVSREWASQSQPADGERVHPSSEHYWSAAQNEIVTDSALLDQDEEVIDLSPAAEEPAWLPPPRAVADPVEDETARRAQLSQWHADDQAAETIGIEGEGPTSGRAGPGPRTPGWPGGLLSPTGVAAVPGPAGQQGAGDLAVVAARQQRPGPADPVFPRHPEHNAGIACGPSGLLVVDCDIAKDDQARRRGGATGQRCSTTSPPYTVVSRRPGRSRHRRVVGTSTTPRPPTRSWGTRAGSSARCSTPAATAGRSWPRAASCRPAGTSCSTTPTPQPPCPGG